MRIKIPVFALLVSTTQTVAATVVWNPLEVQYDAVQPSLTFFDIPKGCQARTTFKNGQSDTVEWKYDCTSTLPSPAFTTLTLVPSLPGNPPFRLTPPFIAPPGQEPPSETRTRGSSVTQTTPTVNDPPFTDISITPPPPSVRPAGPTITPVNTPAAIYASLLALLALASLKIRTSRTIEHHN